MKSVALLLVIVAVAYGVPFDKELSRDRRDKDREGPVVVVETGGGRGRNPFFNNPFFDDSDERFPSLDDDESSPKETDGPAGPSGFGGFGLGPGFNNNGFDFFNKMNGWMREFQQRMNTMWDQIYRQRVPNFPNVHTDLGKFPNIHTDLDKFPDNYHNSTSTRKVVNGSVIVVNETIHKNVDNDSSSFVHVQLFHIRPETERPFERPGSLPPQGRPDVEVVRPDGQPPRRPNPEIDVPEKEFEEFPRPHGNGGGEFDTPVSTSKPIQTSTEERDNEVF